MKTIINVYARTILIAFVMIFWSHSFSMALDGVEANKTFLQNGWSSYGDVDIIMKNGITRTKIYSKSFSIKGDRELRYLSAVYFSPSSTLWVGQQAKHYIIWNNKVVGLSWQMGITLRYSDINLFANNGSSLESELKSIETSFIKDRLGFVKLRTFRNVFGPLSSTYVWGFEKVSFKGNNLVLHLKNASGEATLELSPGFEYVLSSMNGKKIDPETVKVLPIRTLSEVVQKAEAAAKQTPATTPPTPK